MKSNPYNYGSVFKILSKGRVSLVVSALLSSSTLIHAAPAVSTLPSGGVVANGSVTITQTANSMNIVQTTDKAILNWQSFSVGQNASVNFAQPSSSSVVLNRVSGGASEIYGSLTANGKVFLINPNGIIFGQNAKVDVGGMVASTMNIKDADFLSGNYAFTRDGANGKILNQGEIKAKLNGYIALLAPEVLNEGIITAQKGTIAIGAGDGVTLNISGDRLIGIEVNGATVDTLITNKQLIEAEGGLVIMSTKAANALLGSTINNTGTISANSITQDGGEIRLIASGENSVVNNQGIVIADGINGGFIAMAATNVIADENSFSVAPIDASKGEFGWYYIGDKSAYAESMRNPNLSGSGTPSEYPTLFNKNDGQFGDGVAYQAMGQKTSVALSAADAAAYFAVGGDSIVGFGFDNANSVTAVGDDAKSSYSNFYINGAKVEHSTDYGKVKYGNLYNGIDLIYYTNKKGEVEHDLYVKAGADANAISYNYKGAIATKLSNGDMSIKNGTSTITQMAPLSYQNTAKGRKVVASEYELKSDGKASIKVLDSYDTTKTLVVDPTVSYSTYLGGGGQDVGYSIAVDSGGNVFVAGYTQSTNFPILNPSQASNGGSADVFVTKLNSNGEKIYSTYLGGSSDDKGYGIAVDSSGNAYITGETSSTNFPTLNAIQTIKGSYSADAFVSKLNSNGALSYSTYLGGSENDIGRSIAVDSGGNAYITGETASTDFPTLNAIQSSYNYSIDAFVTKLNSSGVKVYSTYLGGSGNDYGYGIAVDGSGNAYITGGTSSTDFSTLNATQVTKGGDIDAFVTKLNSSGVKVYSTYLGGSGGDIGRSIAVDNTGNAYIAGETWSTNFPTMNAIQSSYGGGSFDAFVTKLNSSGVKVYSTYLGGSGGDSGYDIAVDGSGNAYITGWTSSTNFPMLNAMQAVLTNGHNDTFVTKLNSSGQKVYSTYLSGGNNNWGYAIAVDSNNNAYVTGYASSNFPTLNATQANFGGISDAFITKISPIDYTYASTIKLSDHTTTSTSGIYGTAYSLYANLSTVGGNISNGTVTWYNGATVLGSVAVMGGTSSASAYLDLSATYLNAGTYTNLYYKYSITGITKTYSSFAVAPKTLTVSSVTADNKVYDDTTTATISAYNVLGLVGGEALGFSSVANFADKNAGTGKTVNVTGITLSNGTGGGVASNYQLASNSATTTADITPIATPPSSSSTGGSANIPANTAPTTVPLASSSASGSTNTMPTASSPTVVVSNAGVVSSNINNAVIAPSVFVSGGVIYGAPAVNLDTSAPNTIAKMASAASILVPSSPAALAISNAQTYDPTINNQPNTNNIQTYTPSGISWLTPSASYLGSGNSIMGYADGSLPVTNVSSYDYLNDTFNNIQVPTTTFYNPANPRNSYRFAYTSFQLGSRVYNGLTNQYGGYINAKTGVWNRGVGNGFSNLISAVISR